MVLMLQQSEPDDYVVATGESHSVREFCERAFAEVGLDYEEYGSRRTTVGPQKLISWQATHQKPATFWAGSLNTPLRA